MVFVSYFPKFLWSPFLIFFFKCANASLFQKSPNVFLYLNITIVWSLNLIWLNHQPFGIFFESRKHFHNVFHSFVSYDWRIRWVVSYKSVSYRKGMCVRPKTKRYNIQSYEFLLYSEYISVRLIYLDNKFRLLVHTDLLYPLVSRIWCKWIKTYQKMPK